MATATDNATGTSAPADLGTATRAPGRTRSFRRGRESSARLTPERSQARTLPRPPAFLAAAPDRHGDLVLRPELTLAQAHEVTVAAEQHLTTAALA